MLARVFARSRLVPGSLPAERGAARSMYARLRRTSAAFAAERSGAVAVAFALMTIVLCLFAGAAIDFGRWLHARQQTISAMDAAVLAGGRELQLDSTNLSGAIAAAQRYYAENTKGRMKLLSDTIGFTASDNNSTFTATGNAYIQTPLLGFVNIPKMALLATSGAEYSKAQVKLGGKSGGSVEIGLMLDVTLSMQGSKVKAMKAAAKDLVEIVIPDNQTAGTARVAIVPFSDGVRLPSSSNSAARGSPASSKTITSAEVCGKDNRNNAKSCTVNRTACVVERTGTNKYTDAAPGSGNYVMTRFVRADDSSDTCGLTADEEVQPLTDNKTTLNKKIENLDVSGYTAGQLGTAWAWYTLSPSWNALWPTANKASAYGVTNNRKIAILMTDGEYNTQFDANGVKVGVSGAANGSSNDQAKAVCAAMKTKDIVVYTVGFALGGNQTAIDTLKYCATDPDKFYKADSEEGLKEAFRDIALKISDLYLTQ